ncbi:MAG: hypothetical protein A2527_08365 [Candidatus Lambdaproteobacteria bacterium RIFOXYD2_FULL_50_16]|uniref:Response regulatory domain-containing protein n=1 Tax=Candidatus Lambdaproteobacteria bacterium RIFOXYD2_FULL_50_16 TaxID=1817772 RepID=A0A1F6GAP2_9PROT|nr:MAG: hypothetical protein A2527_08365 [Candidatus Lambdaproteobacteria bacterium RIFOXYD2_FULL_50_16]
MVTARAIANPLAKADLKDYKREKEEDKMGLFKENFVVLVVEDSQAQLTLINKIIAKIEGVETLLCRDAFEGYAILRAKPDIGLIILDVNLPFASGLGLLKKVRSLQSYKTLPVLISTAEEDTQLVVEAGATGVLQKPFNFEQLKSFITNYQR